MNCRPPPSSILVLLLLASGVRADYLDDIGYRALQAQVGVGLADGAAVRIDQVEAPIAGGPTDPVYRADPAHPDFSGVTFHDQTAGPNPTFSGHATGVARLFAGTASMTPGVRDVDSYETNDWLGTVLYNAGVGEQRPVTGTGVLANHSWVGATSTPAQAVDLLQRLDWLIDTTDFIQVVGVTNANNPLLSNAYNVIGVTFPSATAAPLTGGLDSFYVAGRAFPDLVAPRTTPSDATGVVTAAVALLLDASAGDTLPAETVKALLMAGADRVTRNTAVPNLQAFAATVPNGLDARYGAGQLNVQQSHALLVAGERASVEDGGTSAAASGYDYDGAFGGANGSNATATYPLGPLTRAGRLHVALVWHARVVDDDGPFVPTARVLTDLNVRLVDVTGGGNVVVAGTTDALDNVELVSAEVLAGRTYRLEVVNAGAPLTRDFALAWRLEPDRDRDGLFDKFETTACPGPADADSDDDGVRDGDEDRNFDGVVAATETNPCDADSDDDGLQDGTELGIASGVPDAEGGAILGTDAAVFVPDADGATTTAPLQADSDGDGVSDGIEDVNRNGAVDPGESNPNDATSLPTPPQTVVATPGLALVLGGGLLGWFAARRLR